MITIEMLTSLRKHGLADVCEMNGMFMHGDGRPLSPSDADLVRQIVAGGAAPPSPPETTAAQATPLRKHAGGRPPGAKDKTPRKRRGS